MRFLISTLLCGLFSFIFVSGEMEIMKLCNGKIVHKICKSPRWSFFYKMNVVSSVFLPLFHRPFCRSLPMALYVYIKFLNIIRDWYIFQLSHQIFRYQIWYKPYNIHSDTANMFLIFSILLIKYIYYCCFLTFWYIDWY